MPLRILTLLLCLPGFALAESRLSKMEQAPPPSTVPSESNHEEDDDDDNPLEEILGHLLFTIFKKMTLTSWDAVQSGPLRDPEIGFKRKPGDHILPFAKLESSAFLLDSNLNGYDLRGELGYGPIAIDGRYITLNEDNPDDSLNIASWHLLYRMTLTDHFEWTPGIGGTTFRGDRDRSGISLTSPVTAYFKKHFGLRYRPTWYSYEDYSELQDTELALIYKQPHYSLFAGYRWFETLEVKESGFAFGCAIHW